MTELAERLRTDPGAWDRWVEEAPTGAYPQLSAWAAVKARNGWRAERIVVDGERGPLGLQLLVLGRRRLPWRIGYASRGPVGAVDDPRAVAELTRRLRDHGERCRIVEIVIDPEVEPGHPLVTSLRAAGWRPSPSLQPDRSRVLDLALPEDQLWAGVRSKWRQYVNKARRDGITVEEAGEAGLPEFYGIYIETARRAGFVVRSAESYTEVYRAYARGDRARLLLARSADGTPVATLMLLACGRRVVEPYGGMTEAGAASRANYLLKWEAIRSSRERGFATYDMWGIAHPGIEQFKAGFGGTEVTYAGAFVLVIDPVVHAVTGLVRRASVVVARRRHGLPVRGGDARAPGPGSDAAPGPRSVAVRVTAREAPAGWDEAVIDAPGGNVLQGTAWAAHRRAEGWTPWFLTFEDDRRALVLTHPQPPLPGVVAYAPRGPVEAGDGVERTAARAVGLSAWARERGAIVLAVDPELPADPDYEAGLAAAGFRAIEEIQPSRHRIILAWAAGKSPDDVLARAAKATRQRMRKAESLGTTAVEDPAGAHLAAFAQLTDATASRKGFRFAHERTVAWWRTVLATGRARFFVALHDGKLMGGLLVYRQGGHLATAYSADRADLRRELPGTMHLLRWTAIRAAIEAGHTSIDLGGVDVRGARSRPEPGDAQYGLYEHKVSFGAAWLESAGAHEIVLRPWVSRAKVAGGRARRAVRRRR